MRRLTNRLTFAAVLGVLAVVIVGSFGLHRVLGAQTSRADVKVCPVDTCIQIAGSSTGPVFYPGAKPVSLPITLTNGTTDTIYVTSVAITFTNSWQLGCSAAEFQLTSSDSGASPLASGPITTINFAPGLGIMGGQSVPAGVLLTLPDNGNQNGCERQGLTFSYTATAQYTVPTTTSLAVTPAAGSDSATLTASIAPDIAPISAGHAPGVADGTVQFLQCTPSATSLTGYSCSGAGTGTWATGGGVATLSVPASNVGTYYYEAVFTPTSGSTDFTSSTSPIVTTTLSGCVTAQTSAATQIINGTTFSGNYTVGSGTSLWLENGTMTGNVTVTGTGEFAASGGTVDGNVQSTGGAIAMSGTTVLGNVQTQNGGLSLGPTTVIKGNAQAQGGGPFCSQGSATAPVQVRGNLLAQSLTSQTTSSVCSTTVGNNLQWQSNSSPGLIGSCGGNTVLGNLLVQGNGGTVTIGPPGGGTGTGNTVNGNINVSGNTGSGSTITGNKAVGNCQLSGDKPGIVGSANTTGKGNNQCNTGSAGA